MTFAPGELSVHNRALQTPKRGYIATVGTTASQQRGSTTLSTPILTGDFHHLTSVLDSTKLLWLSPASTVSTPSSPAGFNDIWDRLKTPTKQTNIASPRSILSPLTPPTPPDSSRKLHCNPIPQPFFGVRMSSASEQPLGDKKDAAPQDDIFRPLKLFRGVTFVLEAISKENATAACVDYSVSPSFDFTQDTNISSRTRSKTGITGPVTSALPNAIHKETSSVETSQHETKPRLHNKFSELLEQLVPHDLHARLASAPGYCVASLVTSPSTRCRCKAMPLGSRSDVGGAVKHMAKCKDPQNYHSMLRHIKTIVQSVMCRRHQVSALKQLKAGSRISQLQTRIEDVGHMTKVEHSTLSQWVSAIIELDARTDSIPRLTTVPTNSRPATQIKRVSRPISKALPAEAIVRFSFSSSSGFTPFEPKKTQGYDVFSALYEKAVSSLGEKDLTSGFVYIFWDKAYFGVVKIGHTKNLAARLKRWNTTCKHEHAYHSGTESQVEMSHVHRVEQLIHTELKECRLRRRCEGCGKLHKEWFEANQVHAVRVMKKWRDWIQQEPYVKEESGEWVLKPEMLASLKHMCEPLPRDMATHQSRRRSEGMQRGLQKRRIPRKTM